MKIGTRIPNFPVRKLSIASIVAHSCVDEFSVDAAIAKHGLNRAIPNCIPTTAIVVTALAFHIASNRQSIPTIAFIAGWATVPVSAPAMSTIAANRRLGELPNDTNLPNHRARCAVRHRPPAALSTAIASYAASNRNGISTVVTISPVIPAPAVDAVAAKRRVYECRATPNGEIPLGCSS
ncbi:unnamed protein product [Agarophyton chilense]